MANKSRFTKAKEEIVQYFADAPQKVYSEEDLSRILTNQREEWNLPESMSTIRFIEELLLKTPVQRIEIKSTGKQSYISNTITRYALDASPYEIALSLRSNTYLSHYSSMYLHGLTLQIPKNIYITFEQSEKNDEDFQLTQESIDQAFAKPQREPQHYFQYLDYKIYILNGKFSKKTGVTRIDTMYGRNLAITTLERTLIDIVVRPSFSGGLYEIQRAFVNARNKVSIGKLYKMFRKLNFKYPYGQSIGFLLEQSEYKESQVLQFKSIEMKYDFYITYEMNDVKYIEEWRLYVPKNFLTWIRVIS